MSDADVTTTDDRFDELTRLMRTAFGSRRFAALASSFAEDAELLVTAAAALGAPGTGRHVAQMRRRSSAAARQAIGTEEAALRAADALRDALAAMSRTQRRSTALRVVRSGEQARRAILGTHRHAAVVGRLATGIASEHEPCDGPAPIWTIAERLLGRLPLGPGDEDLVISSPAGSGRTFITGLLAHASQLGPADVVLTVDDGSDRCVRALVDGDTVSLESVAGDPLSPEQPVSPAERLALVRLDYQPPDGGHDCWWQDRVDLLLTECVDLIVATLVEVHGIGDLGVTATIAFAAHHPTNAAVVDHPAVLDLDSASVPSLATALAERMGTWIDDLGVDAIWANLSQPEWPHFANLGSNLDGGLFTEVSGAHLDAEETAKLLTLGWSSADPETGNHVRLWPAPFDLDAVCWHVALTLVAVHGLELDEPVLAVVVPFG